MSFVIGCAWPAQPITNDHRDRVPHCRRLSVLKEQTMPDAIIGVIGGSGLYAMEGLENVERVELSTPFGAPSDDSGEPNIQ